MRKAMVKAVMLLVVASGGAFAQGSGGSTAGQGTQKKAGTKAVNKAVRDSLKAVRQDIKADQANLKAAKAAHDTAKVKADKAEIRKDEATAKQLKAKLPAKKKKP